MDWRWANPWQILDAPGWVRERTTRRKKIRFPVGILGDSYYNKTFSEAIKSTLTNWKDHFQLSDNKFSFIIPNIFPEGIVRRSSGMDVMRK